MSVGWWRVGLAWAGLMVALLMVALPLGCGGAVDETSLTEGEAAAGGSSGGDGAVGDGALGANVVGANATGGRVTLNGRPVDLLFMIDNSISMSDKQSILRLAVPDLVSRLVNPSCVDDAGTLQGAPPAGETCPEGQRREFSPVEDINVAIITSSLGDVGANSACPKNDGFEGFVADKVDMAHTIGSVARGQDIGANAQGFLEWRAGETDLADFDRSFERMVQAVGEKGCGWEASLESWYRFLIDPFPYRELVRARCPGSSAQGLNCVEGATGPDGELLLDETLLEQRDAFLRPDSLVAVVMLSDENDCSLQVGNQTWVVAQIGQTAMFRGSSTCDQDPNAKCCYSCPLGPPSGCSADPICSADPGLDMDENRLPQRDDGRNLRCYEQKRRFGLDFLYPTDRYVNALSQRQVCTSHLDLALEGCEDDPVDNPLYAGGRPHELVYLAGIVGVPWQAITSDASGGSGQLTTGQEFRFKTTEELTADGTWAEILGSPGVPWRAAEDGRPEVASSTSIPPSSPYMIESTLPRAGIEPGNPINGREYDTTQGGAQMGAADDLQFACIFPLIEPVDCTQRDPAGGEACDCYEGDLDRPLCEQTPGSSTPGTTQYWSKAFPGLRQLQVLRDYGSNAVVASICARNLDMTRQDQSDFGYKPAMSTIMEGIRRLAVAP